MNFLGNKQKFIQLTPNESVRNTKKDNNEYTELKYIGFTGTQYINTGYPIWQTKNWKIEAKVNLSTLYNYQHFFSVSDDDTSNETWSDSSGNYYIRIGGISKTNVATFSAETDYVITHECTDKLRTYINETLKNTSNQVSSTSNNNLIFGKRSSNYFKGKLYYLKLYENNVLIRDLIPVLDENNVACMYDKISKTYLYNAGTDDFYYPPQPSKRLSYIRSTGTQYIDTGITMNKTDDITIIQECLISNNNYAGGNGYTQWAGDISANVRGIVKIEYTASNTTEKIYFNDVLKSTSNWNNYNASNTKIGILKLGDENNTWYNGSPQIGKLYSCKIIKNNVLVRDFIPVLDQNNIACLYDEITKECFYNQGSGTFKFPIQEPLQELEYIECTGTQWINTGKNLKDLSNFKITFVFAPTDLSVQYSEYLTTSYYFEFFANYSNVTLKYNDRRNSNFSTLTTNQFYNYFFSYASQYVSIKEDNVSKGSFFAPASPSNRAVEICHYQNNKEIYFAKAKIKSYTFETDNQVVLDLIPVLDENNVACMYDTISETFFYNQGTGSFIPGQIID